MIWNANPPVPEAILTPTPQFQYVILKTTGNYSGVISNEVRNLVFDGKDFSSFLVEMTMGE
ncbi:MAG: hypothetical protein MAG431_02049 [Chloroflexi bacterium]|nr:hypothetical protein [Chloroflexota bacterium]